MTMIATLGPAGTFSDQVAKEFCKSLRGDIAISYCSSIKKVFQAVSEGCAYGIVPIENLSEGFIPLVLDLLVTSDLKIVGEKIIPINFSCISAVKGIREINKLFVQFVSRGQCSEFIENFGEHIEIVTTDSNILALTRMTGDPGKSAAIVPGHFVKPTDFPLVIENINDYPNNQTRFFVLAGKNTHPLQCTSPICKTSLIIINDDDHPGLLEKILSSFSKQKINLLAITSRPTKEQFGHYHFFIGLAGSQDDIRVQNALEEIGKFSRVKILGSYERAL
ncbi:MAG: prephenate dehydratase domain-containing protein [Pseudomonadota bacterium]